ncbi:gamma-glutamyl-gamma-aminobutyrate hydrolase family protein [Chloroflexota bacterium]
MRDGRPPTIGTTSIEIETEEGPRPPRFGQNQTYIRALVRSGAAPLILPQLTDPNLLRSLYELLDGLLLPGGEDVGPSLYGEPVHERCGRVSPARDEMELMLARWAMADGKPLLAVCRGIQVLNVAGGGSLFQDIGAQIPGSDRHDWYPGYPRDKLAHSISVSPQTRLASILGTTSLSVNSLHHQALKALAPGLSVVAQAPDGVIEAVEASGHPFALGVQWHPEELAQSDARAQGLFDSLVQACRT